MTAPEELQTDPKDGATIIWFSWMTKLLVIFLEVVPVVAKMFFSPPSVYAARIGDQIEREGARARRENDPFRDEEREIQESCSSRDRSALEPRGRAAGEGATQSGKRGLANLWNKHRQSRMVRHGSGPRDGVVHHPMAR